MSYTVVTTRIDPETKREAQKIAEALGIPLSVIIKGFIKQFVKTKSISFSAKDEEIPNSYLIKSIQQAEKDLKTGKASPTFDNTEDAIKWLNR